MGAEGKRTYSVTDLNYKYSHFERVTWKTIALHRRKLQLKTLREIYLLAVS